MHIYLAYIGADTLSLIITVFSQISTLTEFAHKIRLTSVKIEIFSPLASMARVIYNHCFTEFPVALVSINLPAFIDACT